MQVYGGHEIAPGHAFPIFFLFFFLNDDLFFLRHDDLLRRRRRDVLDNFRRYVDVRARGAQRPCKQQQQQMFNILKTFRFATFSSFSIKLVENCSKVMSGDVCHNLFETSST